MSQSSRFLKPVDSRVTAAGSIDRRGTPLRRLVVGERVVLSRRHCHFESIPAPAGQRDMRAIQAAKLAARARSPFKDPDIRLVWSGGRVGIWSWPKNILEPLAGAEVDIVPESLLDPVAEGEVLRRRDGGFEGQVWQGGQLAASRWWDHEPDEAQWRRFVRAVPAFGDTSERTDVKGDVDIAALVNRAGDAVSRIRARDYLALAILLLLVPALYLGGQWLRATMTADALERELATLAESSSEVVAARAESMALAGTLQTYAELLEAPHPAAALAVFAEAAAGFDATLETFAVRDGRMEIELAGNSDLPLASLVEALEDTPVLRDVRLEPGGRPDRWRIFATFENGGRS
jgi:hypothetical protein